MILPVQTILEEIIIIKEVPTEYLGHNSLDKPYLYMFFIKLSLPISSHKQRLSRSIWIPHLHQNLDQAVAIVYFVGVGRI